MAATVSRSNWQGSRALACAAGLVLASPSLADRDADLAAAAAGTGARAAAMIDTHVTRPFPAPAPDPGSPALGNAAHALAALWQGTELALANARLVEIRDSAFPDEYWAMGQIVRCHALFHCDSAFRPGRLTPDAEEAIEDVVRRHLELYSRRDEALDPTAFVIDGSENHDIMRRSVNLLGAAILAADPAREAIPLPDGFRPSEHHAAWADSFVRYLQQRARKGLFVERGSPTYSKYTLQSLFNLRDFASSPDVRRLAGRLIDLYFADASHELLDGVRGGAKSRSYHDRSSALGTSDSLRAYAHLLAGSPASLPLTQHPSSLCAATSEHRLPRPVLDLILNPADKGTHEYRWRAPAKGTREVIPPPIDTLHYHPEFPSALLGVTLASPAWIAGAATVDPAAEYMAIHSQNRWFGVIFPGATDSRVYAQCVALQSGNRTAYDEMNGIAEGDAMIVQRLPQSSGGDLRVYFSNDLVREERGGWVFARDAAGGGFIAVRPARGSFAWDPPEAAFPGGSWLRPSDGDAPVIFQLGIAGDWGGDFAAFQAAVEARPLTWMTATELRYSPLGGREIAWLTDGGMPRLGGVEVELNPPKLMSSPFLDWDEDSLTGTITATAGYGRRSMELDFAVPPASAREIVLEAESADITAPMLVAEDGAASGRAFVHVPDGSAAPGGDARFTVDLPATGSWTLWARVSFPDGGANSFNESLDGEPAIVLGNGPAESPWHWVRGATRTLDAGVRELVVSRREDGARLDQVVLTLEAFDAPPNTVSRSRADADDDGMFDAWMQAQFGHADGRAADRSRASDDADGDGETTLDEYLAGTDPRDAADWLRLSVTKPGGVPTLAFEPRPGDGPECPVPVRRHSVQVAPSPNGPWTTPPDLADLAGGSPVARPVPGTEPLTFLRIRADFP